MKVVHVDVNRSHSRPERYRERIFTDKPVDRLSEGTELIGSVHLGQFNRSHCPRLPRVTSTAILGA